MKNLLVALFVILNLVSPALAGEEIKLIVDEEDLVLVVGTDADDQVESNIVGVIPTRTPSGVLLGYLPEDQGCLIQRNMIR